MILRDQDTGAELQRTVTDVDGRYTFDQGLTSFTDYVVTVQLDQLPDTFMPSPNYPNLSYNSATGEVELVKVATDQYGTTNETPNLPFVSQFNIGMYFVVEQQTTTTIIITKKQQLTTTITKSNN